MEQKVIEIGNDLGKLLRILANTPGNYCGDESWDNTLIHVVDIIRQGPLGGVEFICNNGVEILQASDRLFHISYWEDKPPQKVIVIKICGEIVADIWSESWPELSSVTVSLHGWHNESRGAGVRMNFAPRREVERKFQKGD